MSPALKLHQLRCVVAAARRGSFRQAAAALNIQQSTVSRSVRALEDHLGVSIFDRRVGGARLTPAGDQFLQGAELALEQLGRAAGSAAAAGREDRHVLRIASLALPGSGFLPELLQAMAETVPRSRLCVREASSAENLRGLRAGQVDLAIVLGEPTLIGGVVAPLWTERLFLVGGAADAGRRGAPAPWADARAAALILPPGDLGAVIAERLAAGVGGPWAGAASVAGAETALRLAALGQGEAILCEGAADAAAPGLVWRPIAGEALTVSAVWLARNEKPVLRRFLTLARSMAAAFAARRRFDDGAGAREGRAVA